MPILPDVDIDGESSHAEKQRSWGLAQHLRPIAVGVVKRLWAAFLDG